jgi:hypothetical protein
LGALTSLSSLGSISSGCALRSQYTLLTIDTLSSSRS